MKKVIIYTDGACSGNPGKGGWAAILTLVGSDQAVTHRKEIYGGYKLTTNNRMELTAALEALKALNQPCEIVICSDSQYLCDAFKKDWIDKWQNNNWLRKGKPIPNADLWQALLENMEKHFVSFHWLRGHAGHEENERCDYLARMAANGKDLPDDLGYVSGNANMPLNHLAE